MIMDIDSRVTLKIVDDAMLLLDQLLLENLVNFVWDLLAPRKRENVLPKDLQTFVKHIER